MSPLVTLVKDSETPRTYIPPEPPNDGILAGKQPRAPPPARSTQPQKGAWPSQRCPCSALPDTFPSFAVVPRTTSGRVPADARPAHNGLVDVDEIRAELLDECVEFERTAGYVVQP